MADNKNKSAADNKAADSKKETTLAQQLEAAKAKVSELEEAIVKEAAEARAKALEDELKNDKRPVYKHATGNRYRFKKDAPQTLNIDGVTKPIEDVIKSKDVMTDLIEGNSNLIEQIHI